MSRYHPFPDILGLETSLSGPQRAVMDSVRSFVQKEVAPQIRDCYREERFPQSAIRGLGQLGLLGANLSMDGISYGLAMRELERCDSGLRSFVSVQSGLVMYPIHAFGSDDQKALWLPRLSSGEAVGCFGLTENSGGSDPAAMETTARRVGSEWVLKGSKMWITNGNLAQIAVVWAKTENGIRGFLVPTDVKGFRAVLMRGKLSLRASVTSELYFDDVKLPETAILPQSEGLKSALQCLNQARYSIVWGVLGAAESCFDEAARFSSQRKLFGKVLGAFQLTQRKLAILGSEITKGQLLAFRLAALKDSGALTPSQVSLGKQANTQMALEVARLSRDILGAGGILDEGATMRHLCNLETVYTYEGTNDVHLLSLGKEITGISAFS